MNNPSIITSDTKWSDPIYYVYDDIFISNGANAVFNSNITLNFHNNTISNNYATNPDIDMGDGIYIMDNSSNNSLSFINNIIQSVEISNISGCILFSKKILEYQSKVNISGLAKGIYFIRINTSDSSKFTKLIKE